MTKHIILSKEPETRRMYQPLYLNTYSTSCSLARKVTVFSKVGLRICGLSYKSVRTSTSKLLHKTVCCRVSGGERLLVNCMLTHYRCLWWIAGKKRGKHGVEQEEPRPACSGVRPVWIYRAKQDERRTRMLLESEKPRGSRAEITLNSPGALVMFYFVAMTTCHLESKFGDPAMPVPQQYPQQ